MAVDDGLSKGEGGVEGWEAGLETSRDTQERCVRQSLAIQHD